jgi:hypothetical protein
MGVQAEHWLPHESIGPFQKRRCRDRSIDRWTSPNFGPAVMRLFGLVDLPPCIGSYPPTFRQHTQRRQCFGVWLRAFFFVTLHATIQKTIQLAATTMENTISDDMNS